MSFISFFRSQMPDILASLKVTRLEFAKIQSDLERLLIMEQKYASSGVNEDQFRFSLRTALDCYGIALWIKDENGRFLYVNNICCETILGCSQEEALNMSNGDLRKDALASVCMGSDKIVMESGVTKRFVESASYSSGKFVCLDTTKSPFWQDGEIAGTVGSGMDVSAFIPEGIRKQCGKAESIEIPVDMNIAGSQFIRVLEQRLN